MLVVLVVFLHFLSHLQILLVDSVESLLQLLWVHTVVLFEDLKNAGGQEGLTNILIKICMSHIYIDRNICYILFNMCETWIDYTLR